MNSKFVTLGIGALVGGSIGYFVGSVIQAYIRLKEESEGMPYHESDEMPEGDEPVEETQGNRGSKKKIMKTGKIRKGKEDYTAFFDPQVKESLEILAAKYNSGIVQQEETQEDGNEWVEESAPKAKTGISIISLAEFANSDTGYDQVTLNYYTDDVVTDENDEPVMDVTKVIGEDALVSFGLNSQDPDVVYVRNDELKGEYEIVRLDKSYSPVVEEQPKLKRRVAKKKAGNKEEGDGEEADS